MNILIYHAIGIVLAYVIIRLYHLHNIVRKWLAMQVTYKEYMALKGRDVSLQSLSEINLSFAKMFDPRYWTMQGLLTIKGNENLFFSVLFVDSVKITQPNAKNLFESLIAHMKSKKDKYAIIDEPEIKE